jgi:hypothetical protein
MKVMNDQFPVHETCDIVLCLSLGHLQVSDFRKSRPIAQSCSQSRNAACELIWRQIHPGKNRVKETCIQSMKDMFDGSRERIPI